MNRNLSRAEQRAAVVGPLQEAEGRIAQIEATEVLAETNAGTFGSADAMRAIGTGDTDAATYEIHQRVDGSRRLSGCPKAKAPGYARHLGGTELSALNAERRALRARLPELRRTAREWAAQDKAAFGSTNVWGQDEEGQS